MTVIILARASDGIVLAADGRTHHTQSRQNIDNARKVRVHSVGSGGLVTASSGRATIGIDRTIAEVEDQFFENFAADSAGALSHLLAQHLRKAIEVFNLAQNCTCASNDDGCVQHVICEVCGEFQDFDTFSPHADCTRCHGISVYEWTDPDSCPCSPGEHVPASEPSVHAGPGEWCRCSALAQSPLTWLCVPFGPQYSEGYGQPVTVDIGPNHATDFKINTITDLVVVQGELTSRPHIAINVKSETVTAAREYAVSGLADLVSTQDRVQRLLYLAYAEAPSNAVVRTLEVTGYTPDILGLDENLGSITITDLANKIHMYEADNGRRESRGDGATIGGVATAVVIDAAGNATPPKPITF